MVPARFVNFLRCCSIFFIIAALAVFPSCRRGTTPGTKPKSGGKTVVPTAEVSRVLQSAQSFLGTPYRYGGTNKMGIDCSSLTQNAFREAGINLPRSSKEQSQAGSPVEKNKLRPGDLLFFSDPKVGSGITHVGLVTEILPDGDVKFIHSSSKLGVTENLLSGSYYVKTYAFARRVF